MQESKFKIKTDAGVAGLYGVLVEDVAIAMNCPFVAAGGSGTVISRPSLGFQVGQTTTLVVTIPVVASKPERAVAIARAGLEVVDTGKAGDVIATFRGKTLATHNVALTTFKVENVDVAWSAFRKKVQAKITLRWEGTSTAEKLVGFMAKGRTQPRVVPTLDATGKRIRQHAVLFGVESLKDVNVPVAAMAAEALVDGFVLDNSTGGLGANDPALAKLVADYKAANTKVETLVFTVSPAWYKRYAKLHGGRKDIVFYSDGKTIAWTGEVITGSMVLAVEYSPTFSAIGRTQVLLETLLLLDSVYPELADHYWVGDGARRRRALVAAHLNMAEGEKPKDIKTLRLTLGRKPLPLDPNVDDKELLADFLKFIEGCAERAEVIPASQVLGGLLGLNSLTPERVNRKGITLVHGAHEQYVDVDALVKGGSFTRDGAGYTVAGVVADLVRFATNDATGEDTTAKYEGLFRQMTYALEAHLLDSASVLSKLARGASMDTRRIHTTDDLPQWEIHINPADPLASRPEYANGSTVFSARTPVNFLMPFMVVHNPDVPLGIAMVDALCWHMANEGDADGDSVAMLPVPERFVAEVWVRWFDPSNAYLTGLGYARVRQ